MEKTDLGDGSCVCVCVSEVTQTKAVGSAGTPVSVSHVAREKRKKRQ